MSEEEKHLIARHEEENHRTHRQSKLNTIILSALSGLLVLFIGLLAWIGSTVVMDVKKTSDAVIGVQFEVANLKSQVSEFKGQLRDLVSNDKFSMALRERDREIADLKREVNELKRRPYVRP